MAEGITSDLLLITVRPTVIVIDCPSHSLKIKKVLPIKGGVVSGFNLLERRERSSLLEVSESLVKKKVFEVVDLGRRPKGLRPSVGIPSDVKIVRESSDRPRGSSLGQDLSLQSFVVSDDVVHNGNVIDINEKSTR